jgi:hypothetical protein
MGGAGGVCHEDMNLGAPHCTFANGFANPPALFPSWSLFLDEVDVLLEVANGSGMDLERSPRPTLRRAILVPNLLNMVVVS